MATAETLEHSPRKKRHVDKAGHRLALLEATADVILEYGISGTTISRIQAASGLSRGMINMHFHSKDGLIAALARHVHDAYLAAWKAAMAGAHKAPDKRLKAIIACEFAPDVLNRRTSAIWAALRAEYKARPDLRQFVDTRDLPMYRDLYACVKSLAPTAGGPRHWRRITLAIMAVMEGLLLDFYLHPEDFDRADAAQTCFFAAMKMCA